MLDTMMETATLDEDRRAPSPPQRARKGSRLVIVGADRARMFRKARRHTLLVRSLRMLLPALVVGSIGAYGWSALDGVDLTAATALKAISRIAPENLTMHNPHYEGFMDDGGTYEVHALTANPDLQNTSSILLSGITGRMTDAKKASTRLEARNGVFDTGSSVLTLMNAINVVSDDGLNAVFERAVIDTKARTIKSDTASTISMPGARIRSNSVDFRLRDDAFSFAGGVNTRLQPGERKPAEAAGDTAAEPAETASAGAMFGQSDEPVDIVSATLDIDRANGLAVFQDQVHVAQAGQTLQTQRLEVTFEAETGDGSPGDGSQAGIGERAAQATQISTIVAPRPVILRRETGEEVTGDSARFDLKNDQALLVGNVVVTSGADRRAVADQAEIRSGGENILLVGNVQVKQGENVLTGERLFLDRARGLSRLTSPKPKGPAGRIHARLVRGSPDGANAAAGAAAQPSAAPSPAAAGSVTLTAFKTDPGAPTDIVADSLNVNDGRKEAVFDGKVQVEQGQVAMRSETMTAYYSGETSFLDTGVDAATSGAGAPEDAAAGGSQIERIRAEGKVFITSRLDGNSASGDWADVDMKANTMRLGGDVVLSQGTSVIRASSLEIDMKTGNAVIKTADSPWLSNLTAETPDGRKSKPVTSSTRGSRPSAVFYPSQFGKAGKKTTEKPAGAAKTTLPPAEIPPATERSSQSSSWQTTTQGGPP